jgi:glycosyltransferase involved in cell wall biosynthesis
VISVVIPVFNGAQWIGEQLDSLTEQTFRGEWEVLVVDNGSSDRSAAVAERWAAELPLTVLSCPERGPNRARNAGAYAAKGDKFVFVDADDRADRGLLAAMDRALDEHRLVGGRLDFETLNSAEVLAAHDQKLAITELPVHRGAPHAIGANMACRREVFDALGGFDPTLLPGADEMDFYFRAHHQGIEAVFVPDAVVAYRLRGTRRDYRRQMRDYAIAHAQLDAKNRETGAIRKQSNRSRVAAVWGHAKGLVDISLWFTPAGRWRYAQRVGNAHGAVLGFLRYRQVVI